MALLVHGRQFVRAWRKVGLTFGKVIITSHTHNTPMGRIFHMRTGATLSTDSVRSTITDEVKNFQPLPPESLFIDGYIIQNTINNWNHSAHTSAQGIQKDEVTLVFDKLLQLSSENTFNAQDLVSSLHSLLSAVYKNLWQTIPWLQNSIHLAYGQLLSNGDLHCVKSLLPNTEELLNLVDRAFPDLSTEEVVEVLICTLYLGADQTKPQIHKLLHHARANINTLNWLHLSILSVACNQMQGHDFVTCGKIAKQAMALSLGDEQETKLAAPYDLCSQAMTLCSVGQYMSTEATSEMLNNIVRQLNSEWHFQNPAHIRCYLHMFRKFMPQEDMRKFSYSRVVIESIKNSCTQLAPKLQSVDIALIWQSLLYTEDQEETLRQALRSRASELLSEEPARVGDVMNLVHVGIDTSEVSAHLGQQLDVLTLTQAMLCKAGSSLKDFFHSQLANNALKIVEDEALCEQTISYLVGHPFTEAHHRDKFLAAVLNAKQLSLSRCYHPYLAAFWISNMHSSLPNELLLSVVSSMQLAPLHSLKVLSSSLLRASQKSLHPSISSQTGRISKALDAILSSRLDDLKCPKDLFSISNIVKEHGRNKMPHLREKIIGGFLQLSSSKLNIVSLGHMADILWHYHYYSPQLCDSIVDFLVENQHLVSKRKQERILSVCSHTGHRPQRCEEFTDVIMDTFSAFRQEGSPQQMIRILRLLGNLEIFPEKQLTEIFTMDFMSELTNHLSRMAATAGSSSNYAAKVIRSVKKSMMLLNRMVVLECPQLQVPWFHEDYCRQMAQAGPEQSSFSREVGRGLEKLVGNPHLIISGGHSKYWHPIDFEVHLNNHGKARLPIIENDEQQQENGSRVAVLTLRDRHYCINSKQLVGEQRSLIRHLQLLGYRVELVPAFEWFSLGPSGSAKVTYLQKKIFR